MNDEFSRRRRRRQAEAEVQRARGRPVVVLGMVLGAWILLRIGTWTGMPDVAEASPTGSPLQAYNLIDAVPGAGAGAASPGDTGQSGHAAKRALAAPLHGGSSVDARTPLTAARPALLPPARNALQGPLPATADTAPMPAARVTPIAATSRDRATRSRLIAGQTLLMAAGFAQMQLPPEIEAWFNALPPDRTRRWTSAGEAGDDAALAEARGQGGEAQAASTIRRWSADGWLLWRDDSSSPLLSGRPAYGRSQAGAVVRYHLAPSSGHRPQAYLRGSAALQGPREQEAAVGLSARPLARVPVRLAAEVRASDRSGGTALRPAMFAVTELPPQPLPGGLVAEGYGAAGYVGRRDATAFADGQVRIDRSLVSANDFTLRAGGGAWGGAQRGAARLDIGPTASLSFNVGDTRARVAADYRVRVAGDARPASGPALTLSAGF